MPDLRRANCHSCRGHRDDVGPISWAGYCRPCGKQAMNENVDQMHARRGRNFRRWRIGMIHAAGGTVTDPKLLKELA